jgi:hypothetical protein
MLGRVAAATEQVLQDVFRTLSPACGAVACNFYLILRAVELGLAHALRMVYAATGMRQNMASKVIVAKSDHLLIARIRGVLRNEAQNFGFGGNRVDGARQRPTGVGTASRSNLWLGLGSVSLADLRIRAVVLRVRLW